MFIHLFFIIKKSLFFFEKFQNAAGGIWTLDLQIFSLSLSQLSYRGFNNFSKFVILWLILFRTSLNSLIKVFAFWVAKAPMGDGSINPSFSKIRREYLTLWWGAWVSSDSLIIPIGCFSKIMVNKLTCRSSRSSSFSIWPRRIFFFDN